MINRTCCVLLAGLACAFSVQSVGAKDHAVAWDRAKPEGGKNGAPLRLALSKFEIEAAPVMTTQAFSTRRLG